MGVFKNAVDSAKSKTKEKVVSKAKPVIEVVDKGKKVKESIDNKIEVDEVKYATSFIGTNLFEAFTAPLKAIQSMITNLSTLQDKKEALSQATFILFFAALIPIVISAKFGRFGGISYPLGAIIAWYFIFKILIRKESKKLDDLIDHCNKVAAKELGQIHESNFEESNIDDSSYEDEIVFSKELEDTMAEMFESVVERSKHNQVFAGLNDLENLNGSDVDEPDDFNRFDDDQDIDQNSLASNMLDHILEHGFDIQEQDTLEAAPASQHRADVGQAKIEQQNRVAGNSVPKDLKGTRSQQTAASTAKSVALEKVSEDSVKDSKKLPEEAMQVLNNLGIGKANSLSGDSIVDIEDEPNADINFDDIVVNSAEVVKVSDKEVKTPVEVKNPVKETKTPEKEVKNPAKEAKTLEKEAEAPAKEVKTPDKEVKPEVKDLKPKRVAKPLSEVKDLASFSTKAEDIGSVGTKESSVKNQDKIRVEHLGNSMSKDSKESAIKIKDVAVSRDSNALIKPKVVPVKNTDKLKEKRKVLSEMDALLSTLDTNRTQTQIKSSRDSASNKDEMRDKLKMLDDMLNQIKPK